MGNQNCCAKPEEKFLEVKGGPVTGEIVDVDKDAYPHDSEQAYRAEGNARGEMEASNQISNQEIYNKQMQSPKIGNTYEVPIEEKSPKDNGEENEQNIHSEQEINSPKPEDQNIERQI